MAKTKAKKHKRKPKLDNRRRSQCTGWQTEINRLTKRLTVLQTSRAKAQKRNDQTQIIRLNNAIENTTNRISGYQTKINRNCHTNTGSVTASSSDTSTDSPEVLKTKQAVSRIAGKRKLTQSEIAFLWVALGGPVSGPRGYRVASAVAMAESSGDADAGNYCCHGLWAFNVSVGVTSMECALSVICSTRKAISMSKEQGWEPWEAYTNGAYQRFMNTSIETSQFTSLDLGSLCSALPFCDPSTSIPDPGDIQRVGGAVGDMTGIISDIFNALTSTEFWIRVGKVVLGVLLLAFAANALLKSLLGVDVVGTASTALSKGTIKPKGSTA